MRKLWIPAVVLSLLVGAIASAQSMLESATAAAGGSAAGVAGRKVGEGLDGIFSKVGDIAKKSADDTKLRKQAPEVPPLPTVRLAGKDLAPDADTKPKARVTSTAAVKRQAGLQVSPVAPKTQDLPFHQPALPAPQIPVRVEPTMDGMRSLSAGASREDVLNRMGKPASRITMSDGDGLVEVYKYKNQDGALGSVRMVNGKVSTVSPVQ